MNIRNGQRQIKWLPNLMLSGNLIPSGNQPHKGNAMAKDKAAVSLGRRGGQKRAENLTKAQMSAIGKKGAAKRWGKKTDKKGGD